MLCPSCTQAAPDGALDCPNCGIVFAKWQRRTRERPLPPSPPLPPPTKTTAGAGARAVRVLAIALAGAALLVGGYWWVEIRPRMKRLEDPYWGIEPGKARAASAEVVRGRPVDRELKLPGSPSGIAVNGRELIIANRIDPWGFLRLTRDGDEFAIQQVPVVEEVYSQKIQFGGVTWNGANYVSTASGAWFGLKTPLLFTIHDPKTLRIVRTAAAPDDIGCLVWDGSGYWAATRKNTVDEAKPAHLYRFDASFAETERFDSPIPGCQGMAWDGRYLWLADVFDDAIVVLDPRVSPPELVDRRVVPFDYLSGLAFAGKELWVAETDDNRLHRVSPPLLAEWRAGKEAPLLASLSDSSPRASAPAASGEEIEILLQQLRDGHWATRSQAERKLDELGVPVPYDREQESSPDTGPEDTEVLDWWAEIRDGTIVASWRLHFGEALFSEEEETAGVISMPLFVRYEVSVEGGTLEKEIERTFDAPHAGTVEMDDVELASGLGPGEYTIGMFIHVQYVRPDGTPQILNSSVIPLHVAQ